MARSMLLDSKLPKKGFGVKSVYLKNRSPVKALKKIPFEVWHGKKLKVNHLAVIHMLTYLVMRGPSLILRHASLLWWDTER